MSGANPQSSSIRELRQLTGVGFMACKKALVECDNDISAAVSYLRKASGIKADGKAGRATSEGVIACVVDAVAGRGALLEVNCETDFVARSDDFIAFADRLVQRVLSFPLDADDADLSQDEEAERERTEMVQKLGENIRLSRCRVLDIGSGCQMGSYLHSNRRIGALVHLVGEDAGLARELAMHVSAENPEVVAVEDVPKQLLDHEAEIYRAQADAMADKPQEVRDRIVEGRLKKYAAEISLLEQGFVRDPSQSVKELLSATSASVKSFVRFELGEQAAPPSH